MQPSALPPLGATLTPQGTLFSIWSRHASRIDLCLFDSEGHEQLRRLPMVRSGDVHSLLLTDAPVGTRYGFRAEGLYDPEQGLWFDPSKLLVDPYAKELDRPFRYYPQLSTYGVNTADLVPKAVVVATAPVPAAKPVFETGGLIYEVAVRPFTMLHPDIPQAMRGTVGALSHPSVIAHLKRIGVSAVELMPVTAWIDERHLPPLGLSNGWGYNPVAFMALDPRLVPGGVKELADTVAALHAQGIGVILDLVFNHTGESDRFGPTLSLRGLDNLAFYRHHPQHHGELINDTGTGNTVACDHPYIRRLIVDSLRHFVLYAGIDGFRFDLAPILGRTAEGFQRESETLQAILHDAVLADRVMIAEPWDIGHGGYQLGNFPGGFLEWNDRARDGMRRYWRGDAWTTGTLATILAGSSDVFARDGATSTRSVNFLAAHDGFTLMDLVSYEHKHNEANGENNRDGHGENFSWNNGVEGDTDDDAVLTRRRSDVMALLGTLFASRGTVMLTAGDEGGRSQRGNNNAYCQDNDMTWMDWSALDGDLIDHTAFLAGLRKRFSTLTDAAFFSGIDGDVEWLTSEGTPMSVADWERPDGKALMMMLKTRDEAAMQPGRLAILFNRAHQPQRFRLPEIAGSWQVLSPGIGIYVTEIETAPRSVTFCADN